MVKIKDSINKITPFVKPYKIGFLTAILLIIIAAVFTALAPKTEGLVITQLTIGSIITVISNSINNIDINFFIFISLHSLYFFKL